MHLVDGPCRQLVVAATAKKAWDVAAAVLAFTAARGVQRSADTWVFALRLRVSLHNSGRTRWWQPMVVGGGGGGGGKW